MMKKFLSSLLALTMILSLVIVPANATETPTQVAKGSTVQLNAPAKDTTVKVDNVDYTVTSDDPTYAWSSNSANATVPSSSNGSTVTVTGVSAGNATITCRMTEKYTIPATEKAAASTGNYVKEVTYPITVNDAFLASDVQSVTVNGRTYSVSDGSATVFAYRQDLTAQTAKWSAKLKNGYTFNGATYDGSTKKLAVKAKDFDDVNITIDVSSTSTSETLTVNSDTKALTNSTLTLTVSSDRKTDASNRKYVWSYAPKDGGDSHQIALGSNNKWNMSGIAAGDYIVTCQANYGTAENQASASFELNLSSDSDYSIKSNKDSYTLQVGDTLNLKDEVKLLYKDNSEITNGVVFTFDSNKHLIAPVTTATGEVRALSDGTATITVTAEYTLNDAVKTYTKDITIIVNSLSATFDKSVTNGDDISYDDDDVVDAVVSAINKIYGRNTVSSSDISALTITSAPATKQGDLYVDGSKVTGTKTITDKDITFDAYEGFLGDATFVVRATTNKTIAGKFSFDVTLKVTVTGDDTINATVTGSSSNSSVSFKVSDAVDYDTLFIYGSKSSPNTSKPDYDGNWNATGSYTNSSNWDRCSSSTTITVPSSKFSNGKATLYVVGLDSKGVASTGTITVSQKSYDIKYSVVAGESVTFSQKDFESFLEDIADDSSDYNSRKDTLELSYVKFSLPNSTREGVLYEGKSKIDRNDKVEDLDKVTFESVAKAKDTITISFTAYGKLYKDGASKGKDVDYSGNVVISVVKEDIVFEVGVNSAIKLGSDKFIDFLRDSDKSYKKADLDYVTFDVGKNSAITSYFNGTGALYRYYNGSTGINSTVSAKDEFYYNPKTSSKHYDLDDVTYVTSKFAKVGDIVYIPFTAYGTKSGQKAEGTLAIKVKQTMNFVDVNPGDFFYQPVQWAVNEGITNGTSSTTFSPYKNCNRAEIVTFLWRAAKSPEPTITRNPFSDVQSVRDASYYKAILWASQNGITAGTTATTFSPYQECTRSQIVTFLYRYAKATNTTTYNPFKDVSSVNEASYYNAILWAVGKGITQGTSTTTFSPYASCTRGEAVTFLYRYVNGVK